MAVLGVGQSIGVIQIFARPTLDGTSLTGGGTTTLGGGTAISCGGTLNTGGGTPFRSVSTEFNHCIGLPDQLFSDNMPFNSRKDFASSARHAQSNEQAERSTQMV